MELGQCEISVQNFIESIFRESFSVNGVDFLHQFIIVFTQNFKWEAKLETKV